MHFLGYIYYILTQNFYSINKTIFFLKTYVCVLKKIIKFYIIQSINQLIIQLINLKFKNGNNLVLFTKNNL